MRTLALFPVSLDSDLNSCVPMPFSEALDPDLLLAGKRLEPVVALRTRVT